MKMNTMQQRERVQKWKTPNGTYALKRMESLAHWQAIEQAYRLCIPLAIPIYETKKRDGQWYYMMPWLKEKTDPTSSFFHDLARWHKHSLKEIQTTEAEIESYHKERKSSLEKAKQTLTQYIEQCEKQWYMSPFQLQCCTHFLDIMRAISFSEHTLNEWRERMREKRRCVFAIFTVDHRFNTMWNEKMAHRILLVSNEHAGLHHFMIYSYFFANICIRIR